jgi:hypothetical protein
LGVAAVADERPPLSVVPAAQLCVTSGRVSPLSESTVALRTPGIRAVVPAALGNAVEIAFTYRGPTKDTARLGSGELRRQLGLKLRAQDTCNVVYVMWHVSPTEGVHVSVKRNPGETVHAQCADRGYLNLKPTWSRPIAPIREGVRRTLAAQLEGARLVVSVDGVPAWVGTLPEDAFTFDGPVGIRSDNGQFDVELRAASGPPAPCPTPD